jgi:hypothetical protein
VFLFDFFFFFARKIQKFIAPPETAERRERDNLSSDTHTQTHKRGIKKEEEEITHHGDGRLELRRHRERERVGDHLERSHAVWERFDVTLRRVGDSVVRPNRIDALETRH